MNQNDWSIEEDNSGFSVKYDKEKGTYQETGRRSFKDILDSPEMTKAREAIAAAEKEFAKEAENWWNDLSYDDQLRAFFYVTSMIHKGDVEERGSYRWVLYSTFGFEPDAYVIGMNSGYMNIHNYIYEGMEFDKMKSAEQIEFQSGDVIHRFDIPKDHRLDLTFEEEERKLIIKSEIPWWAKKDE